MIFYFKTESLNNIFPKNKKCKKTQGYSEEV